MWFWVTAGHCLKDQLDDLISRGQLRVLGGSFIDYLGFEAKHFHAYPYTYRLGDGLYIWRREMGLDFAVGSGVL